MIIDLVLAEPKDAKEVGSDFHSKEFECLDMPRGCLFGSYVELLAILLERRPSKKLAKEIKILWGDDIREVAVYKLPEQLLTIVAGLKKKSLAEISARWAEALENQSRPMSQPEVAVEALSRLQKMAKLSIKRKKSLLVRETP